MAIASVDSEGRPSVRMVLLKGYDERGFIFYTNYDSRKGQQLIASGHAAMSMYWEPLQRSVSRSAFPAIAVILPSHVVLPRGRMLLKHLSTSGCQSVLYFRDGCTSELLEQRLVLPLTVLST